ncbi:MAG: hypothetical protein HKN11_15960 [Rhizobiales bacterium]|nr:hypothetical protein [Hyphomicrobiales bacterium]
MTGQSKDCGNDRDEDRDERPDEAGAPEAHRPAGGVGPSTRELLHLLRMMEGKASA